MSERKLTRQQQLAFARDRYISVTANAGSGKTTVLIDKYIDILLNDGKVGGDPSRILAITFTKIAASEMKSRAIKEIEKFIEKETNSKRIKILYEIRDKLSYAKITTIHSFCSALLREYPIEAGIATNFVELSEYELANLKKEAMEKVFEAKIDISDYENPYTAFFDNYGIGTVQKYLKSILSKPDIFLEAKKLYEKSNEEIIEFYKERIFNYAIDVFDDFLYQVDNVALLPDSQKNIDQYKEAHKLVKSVKNKFIKGLKFDSSVAKEFYDAMRSKVGRSLFCNYVGKANAMEDEIKDIVERVKALSEEVQEDLFDLYLNDVRIFIELADAFRLEFEQMKEEVMGIDFDDMIFKVREMLKNEEIASKVRDDFDYILVDEFQDTNIAQYEIIKALVPGLSDPSAESDVRCFIVGDAKQSIYAFRGADVRVFIQAIQDIKRHNELKISQEKINRNFLLPDKAGFAPKYIEIEPDDSEVNGNLSLSTSFRLLPIPAAFVNHVFKGLMQKGKSEYDISYEDLVCGREISSLFPDFKENDEITADNRFGSVSVLLNIKPYKEKANVATEPSDDADAEDENADTYGEAELVAKSILNLVNSDTPHKVLKNGKYVRPNYGDIAILSRSRNKFQLLLNAMLKLKIPYLIQSGSGFYSSSEIVDITQFLLFLVNDKDDLAFASMLKSPFFGFFNEDLFEIYLKGNRNSSLYSKFIDYAEALPISSDAYNKSMRALKIISMMKFYSSRIPVSSLLIKIIETGGYWGVVSKSPAGSQIEANFDKLIDYARKFEEKGFRTLNDFIEELLQLSVDSSEAEATFKTGENAVRIITIHGSKGAEFPIVYLYSSNFKKSNTELPYIDSYYGLNFNILERNEKSYVETFNPVISHIAKENLEYAEAAESKRLLYVALTRAKDHLFITGQLNQTKEGFSKPSMFMKDILKALKISQTDISIDTKSKINVELPLRILHEGDFKICRFKFNVLFSTFKQESAESEQIETVASNPSFKLSLEPIESTSINGIYSASRLTEFHGEQERYVLSHLLGIDDNKYEHREAEQSVSGMTVGSVIHEVMENISLWIKDNEPSQNDLESIVDSKLKRYALENESELKERIMSECSAAAESSFIKQHINQLLEAKLEYELNMPIADDFITGYIDCIVETRSGYFEVWDWKSNRIHSDNDLLVLKEHYRLQMEIYAMFVLLLYPEMPDCTCRLLFTNRAAYHIKDEDWVVSYKYSRTELEQIKTKILNLIESSKKV